MKRKVFVFAVLVVLVGVTGYGLLQCNSRFFSQKKQPYPTQNNIL